MLATAPIAMGSTISIFASGVVTNEWKTGSGFPAVDVGEQFELWISYTDSLPDQSVGYNPGQIYPANLTVFLQVLGEGTIFSATGGVVSFITQCTLGPGGYCYPAIQISSSSAGGLGFELLIADKDLSLPPINTSWIDYGQIYDYESVEFFVRPPFPEGFVSGGQLTGTASSFVIPEPSSSVLAGLGMGLGASIRRRPKQRVEQGEAGQPPLAALSATSPVI